MIPEPLQGEAMGDLWARMVLNGPDQSFCVTNCRFRAAMVAVAMAPNQSVPFSPFFSGRVPLLNQTTEKESGTNFF